MERFIIWASVLFMSCTYSTFSFELVLCQNGSMEESAGMENATILSWNGTSFFSFLDARNRPNPFFSMSKRSVFGFRWLFTRRPHKTATEVRFLPVDDGFFHMRGKKWSLAGNGAVLLPSSAGHLRAAYPLANFDVGMDLKA